MRVVVLGGGYAGLACIIELRRRMPQVEIHLVDASPAHLKLTHLHRSLRCPLEEFQIDYTLLAERFDFHFHQAKLAPFQSGTLRQWQEATELPLPDGSALPFDYLVIATGAHGRALADTDERCIGQDRLRVESGRALIRDLAGSAGAVTVVGGGPSGLQSVFELAAEPGQQRRLRLIDAGPQLLPGLGRRAHEYVEQQLEVAGIEYLPDTRFVRQQGETLELRTAAGNVEPSESQATLLFPGVEPWPEALQANRFGQIMVGHSDKETAKGSKASGKSGGPAGGRLSALDRVFGAGDCAQFASSGLNALTAQAAVRKGRHVAVNLLRKHRRRHLLAYYYGELGYVISLGELDAVGWLLTRENILEGMAAFAIKGVVEAQYDLLLRNIDTYVV